MAHSRLRETRERIRQRLEMHLHTGRTRDLTHGPILHLLVMFAMPLLLGNLFQMLYNTVDVIVVGNFVGKEALAAVGANTIIINMMVFFFNGFSVGAGVVIGNYFGSRNISLLHDSVETAMAVTFILCGVFTILGIVGARPLLHLMSTPEDVFPEAATYLTIYFLGASGLLIYNIGSGILRAVGNTVLPLIYLIFTSILNIILDLFFVITLKAGIAGVAWATIISQFVSALLVINMLTHTDEIYRFSWRDMHINGPILRRIISIGLPAGIQSIITAFSNLFVQSYINYFGSDIMAAWSCYNKLDQFILLPLQSMAMATTAFVSQNIGARQYRRADKGTWSAIGLMLVIATALCTCLFIFAEPAVGLFSKNQAVISAGVMFVRTNTYFFICNCVNHVLAGSMRGRGNSVAPMVIMIFSFVGIRQLYLFIMTRFISNTPRTVGFGYPVGWVSCLLIIVVYYLWSQKKRALPVA